jgi:Beta-lactamase
MRRDGARRSSCLRSICAPDFWQEPGGRCSEKESRHTRSRQPIAVVAKGTCQLQKPSVNVPMVEPPRLRYSRDCVRAGTKLGRIDQAAQGRKKSVNLRLSQTVLGVRIHLAPPPSPVCLDSSAKESFSARGRANCALTVHPRALQVFERAATSGCLTLPAFESAGGGLVSTIDDYFAFSRMMLNQGRLGGEQILSPASVELMTSDQVAPAHRADSAIFFGTCASWGLGMAVDIGRAAIFHFPGRFGWNGGFGTTAYADPNNGMIGILLTQRMMESPDPPRIFTDFWTLAYQAME